jgi:hypothetical protein
MLEFRGRTVPLGPGMSRRSFLKVGSLGLGGLTLPSLLRCQAATKRRDTAVIVYFMAGGPSHIDTWDMKPNAPAEVRGPFRPIKTRQPGLELCELLPCQAQVADKFSLVRSLRHSNSNHFDATHWIQTSYHEPNIMGRGQSFPSQGSVASQLRGPNKPGMPPYVCIPQAYSPARSFFEQGGFLGASHNPVNGGGPPYFGGVREPEFVLPEHLALARVTDRRELGQRLDAMAARVDRSSEFAALDASYHRAFELMTSPRVKEAFDLDREPVALRDRYGHHSWGRATLLARRLVDAGVTFVTINHFEADVDWWDDHFVIEKNLRRRLPPFDQALAALIQDLHERGQAERVLVAAFGEFGRGPVIDKGAGRSHWPNAMSALLAGGGVQPGRVVGATSSNGGEVRDRPKGPGDLLATIYKVLGLEHDRMILDRQHRPHRLIESGQPIADLF